MLNRISSRMSERGRVRYPAQQKKQVSYFQASMYFYSVYFRNIRTINQIFTANKVNKASGIENWYLLTYKITYFYTNEIFLRDPTCRRLTPVRIIDTVRSFNSHNMVILYLQGLNAILFNKNVDAKTYISLVPTSAHTGDGMGDLIALIVKLCQTKLAQRLSYSEELQCTVLEVCLNSA